MNQIYGYGQTILCQQPVIGEWYNNIECSISKRYNVITVKINKFEYKIIVSAKEFCSNCSCNKGEVNIYYEKKE
ncbi:hypothetical protein [Desulfotomaculum nigrificans]|uniref:hypothetical protein n=1 Tax=Desulfotomaculum nigrificans TaxID=1565 RepID=UPI0001FAEB0B|nr:hypothetical protein [Desulfotomaculum nigrificans]